MESIFSSWISSVDAKMKMEWKEDEVCGETGEKRGGG